MKITALFCTAITIILGVYDAYMVTFYGVEASISKYLQNTAKEIDNYWYCHHDEPSQKLFAKAVKDTKYSGILFQARKLNVHPFTLITSEYLLKVWGY